MPRRPDPPESMPADCRAAGPAMRSDGVGYVDHTIAGNGAEALGWIAREGKRRVSHRSGPHLRVIWSARKVKRQADLKLGSKPFCALVIGAAGR